MRSIRDLMFVLIAVFVWYAVFLPTPLVAQGTNCTCGEGGCTASYVACWESCPMQGAVPSCSDLCSQTSCGAAIGPSPARICSPSGCVPTFPVHVYQACNCCKTNDLSCNYGPECCTGYCGPDNFCRTAPQSPILINLRNDSTEYHLTSAAEGVLFDINADGVAEQVAWTRKTSEVAFLAFDRNQNGIIDDGSELFGTATKKKNRAVAANGFEALLDLDGGSEASDGKIAISDAIFNDLRLWIDRNHDGITDSGELVTLRERGITALFTGSIEMHREDRFGNQYKFIGTALVNERGDPVATTVFDVFLQVR